MADRSQKEEPEPEPALTGPDTLSYEQAREELASVVKKLETGGLTLEQSIELWENGERLAATCQQWLDGARAKLSAAMARREDDGEAGPAPF